MATGTDLSFVVNVPTAVDLYDLSGEGSKFFITVNGRYGATGTDFSCNMWPHTYSTYKIETIKRETAALRDSSFVYVSTVKDVSFDMSYVTGTLNACTKFNVNQGDKSVSCLPVTTTGISHELDGMIFYNLYDVNGGWYSKVKVNVKGNTFIRVLFLSSGPWEFVTKCGLYLSKSEAENDDDGTNREHNLLTKITDYNGTLNFLNNFHSDDHLKIINLLNSFGDYDLSNQRHSDGKLIGAWGLANWQGTLWPGDSNQFANIRNSSGNIINNAYLPRGYKQGFIVTLDKQYNIVNNKLYFRTSCTRYSDSSSRFNIAITDSTSGNSDWRNCMFTWTEGATSYNSNDHSLWSNTVISSDSTAIFPWSSSDNKNDWPTTSVCNMIRARVYDCEVGDVNVPDANFTLRAYGHQYNAAGITRNSDKKQLTITNKWTDGRGFIISNDEFLIGDFEIVFEFSRFEFFMTNIFTTDSATSTMDDFYANGSVLSTYSYSNQSQLIRCTTDQLKDTTYTDSVSNNF